jgi:D-arabinose 1-dehydrogenase-like Zn-dependent alcohol dehydrogenase
MGFEQATIKVVSEREFDELKAAIESVFAPERIEKYLKALKSHGIRARNVDKILTANLIDTVAGSKTGTANTLYEALPVSDQAQVREFYLSKVEEVDQALRTRFHKLYQYS